MSIEPHTDSRLFEAPKPLEEVAAEVRALLQQTGVQLALAETGTGGEIAQLLRSAGPGALTHKWLFPTAEELAVALRVSRAKVDAFGAISAMVAAEAAADLIDTYEGGWGLVVMVALRAPSARGNRGDEPGVQSADGAASDCFIALGTPSATILQQCRQDEVTRAVLVLLAQQARRRLARPA